MAKEQAPDDGSGLGEVQITIVVVEGRVRAALRKLLAGAGVRVGLVSVGLIAAAAAATIIAVSSSSGRVGRPPGSEALAAQFAHRLSCARVTVASPDGVYARIDLDRAGPCGTFGGQGTVVLLRRHGVWVREFEAFSWKCPIGALPERIALELHLCG